MIQILANPRRYCLLGVAVCCICVGCSGPKGDGSPGTAQVFQTFALDAGGTVALPDPGEPPGINTRNHNRGDIWLDGTRLGTPGSPPSWGMWASDLSIRPNAMQIWFPQNSAKFHYFSLLVSGDHWDWPPGEYFLQPLGGAVRATWPENKSFVAEGETLMRSTVRLVVCNTQTYQPNPPGPGLWEFQLWITLPEGENPDSARTLYAETYYARLACP